MSLDGFLTFLTLIIAAYTIVPSVERLRLRLHFFGPAIVSIAAFCLVIYFEFFSLLALPCPKTLGRACHYLTIADRGPIDPAHAAFIVVIVWLGLAWAGFSRTGIAAHNLSTLAKLTAELVYEARYAELTKLIEPHLPLLDRAATRKLRYVVMRDRLIELNPANRPAYKIIEDSEKGEPSFDNRPAWYRLSAVMISRIASHLPDGHRAEEAAEEIFRGLFQTPDLISFVAMSRPYFGLKLLRCAAFGVQEFCDDYLRVMIANPGSILYNEIKQNQNVTSRSGYLFPEHNRLLHFLFADARTAEKLSVWKPLGEFLISALRPDADGSYGRFLNDLARGIEAA